MAAPTAQQSPHQSELTLQGQGFNNEKSDIEDGVTQPPVKPVAGSGAPDGGLEAWLVVLGAWCTSFCSFGWINSMFLSAV